MRIFSVIIAILFITGISFPQSNYYVNNMLGEDISSNGNSPRHAFKTIEYAIDQIVNPSKDSIIIHIAPGIYNLNNNPIEINGGFINLTLLGDDLNTTTIESASDTTSSKSRVIKVCGSNNIVFKNLTIQNGRSTRGGGGIFIDSAGSAYIDYCKITSNIGGAKGIGGGIGSIWGNIYINNSMISNNSNRDSCYGGGIGIENGILNITNSTISNNFSSSGGGIAVIAYKGNTIFNMTNSTISGNVASYSIGGIRFDVYPLNSNTVDTSNILANINSSTIFDNTCTGFNGIGGIGVWHAKIGDRVYIKNSIISGNIAYVDSAHSDLRGSIISENYNLIQNTYPDQISGEVTHNIYGVSAGCQQLANNNTINGTQTCAIPDSSPARNMIPSDSCNGAPSLDQRGAPRNGNYDIGAFEYWDNNLFHGITGLNNNKTFPKTFKLYQNFPNPFNPSTIIGFNIPEQGYVSLIIYNSIGQEISEPIRGHESAGYHNVKFNAADLPSGIYFYKIDYGNFSQVKKMLLLK